MGLQFLGNFAGGAADSYFRNKLSDQWDKYAIQKQVKNLFDEKEKQNYGLDAQDERTYFEGMGDLAARQLAGETVPYTRLENRSDGSTIPVTSPHIGLTSEGRDRFAQYNQTLAQQMRDEFGPDSYSYLGQTQATPFTDNQKQIGLARRTADIVQQYDPREGLLLRTQANQMDANDRAETRAVTEDKWKATQRGWETDKHAVEEKERNKKPAYMETAGVYAKDAEAGLVSPHEQQRRMLNLAQEFGQIDPIAASKERASILQNEGMHAMRTGGLDGFAKWYSGQDDNYDFKVQRGPNGEVTLQHVNQTTGKIERQEAFNNETEAMAAFSTQVLGNVDNFISMDKALKDNEYHNQLLSLKKLELANNLQVAKVKAAGDSQAFLKTALAQYGQERRVAYAAFQDAVAAAENNPALVEKAQIRYKADLQAIDETYAPYGVQVPKVGGLNPEELKGFTAAPAPAPAPAGIKTDPPKRQKTYGEVLGPAVMTEIFSTFGRQYGLTHKNVDAWMRENQRLWTPIAEKHAGE